MPILISMAMQLEMVASVGLRSLTRDHCRRLNASGGWFRGIPAKQGQHASDKGRSRCYRFAHNRAVEVGSSARGNAKTARDWKRYCTRRGLSISIKLQLACLSSQANVVAHRAIPPLALLPHPAQHGMTSVDVVNHPHAGFTRMFAMQPAGVLL